MRKIILLEHTSLDGFIAGPNGEMDWIRVDDEIFDFVGKFTEDADTALYGRVTYQMMESYWPAAAENPAATKHDIEHAHWVNNASKIVFSRTLKKTSWNNTRIIHEHIGEEMQKLKEHAGKNILMIGSPGLAQTFMQLDLIDEYWINVNPIILGIGMPLFKDIKHRINLNLIQVKEFSSGVVGFQYKTDKK